MITKKNLTIAAVATFSIFTISSARAATLESSFENIAVSNYDLDAQGYDDWARWEGNPMATMQKEDSEDFETGDGGFTVVTLEGTAWERGTPDSSGLGGTVNAGNDGSANAWATNLGTFSSAGEDPTDTEKGFYTNPTHTALRSPVIDLTEVASAELTFAEALDIPNVDTSAVVNLINATTDDVIALIHTSADSDPNNALWNDVGPIDLAAGLGQEVRIEWRLQGTGSPSFDYMGWYIDDVLVTETTP